MSLSLSDLFSIIAILLLLANPTKMKNDFFSYSLFALLVVCLLSVLFSHDPIVHLGSLSRLFLLVGLVVIVLVSYGDDLKVSLFYSFLFWPFVMLAQLMAQDYLWRFLSFADGRSFFPYETGYMLLGGNLVVYHLFFLLPLLLFHRVSMRVWGLLIFYFIILSVYSHSRALVIAVGVSLMLYVMYYRDDNNGGSGWIGKIFIFGVTLGGVVYLTSFLGFFNFGIEDDLKSRSSYIRISKIKAAFDVYRDNPVIGIGYGAAGAIDSKRIVTAMSATDHDYLEQAINVQASAESTLPQIAAETGTVGLVVSLWLLALGFYGFRRSMRSSTMPTYAKITLLVLVVVFVVRFVSGNSYSEIPFFTAIPFVFRRIRWFSQNSRVRCM